jgi:hypothetical protein
MVIMGKRHIRHNDVRGRFWSERPIWRIVTPDFQSGIPYELRRKYLICIYPDGRVVKRALKKTPIGAPIKSNMVSIMPLAMYKQSQFSLAEIRRRRFEIFMMNDNWFWWDEEMRIKKKMKERRESAGAKRITILSGLPSVSTKPSASGIQVSSVLALLRLQNSLALSQLDIGKRAIRKSGKAKRNKSSPLAIFPIGSSRRPAENYQPNSNTR